MSLSPVITTSLTAKAASTEQQRFQPWMRKPGFLENFSKSGTHGYEFLNINALYVAHGIQPVTLAASNVWVIILICVIYFSSYFPALLFQLLQAMYIKFLY